MEQSTPTELFLPQSLPFPIKIISLDANQNDSIQRGTRLLSYSFLYPGVNPETRFGTWDAAIEGTLASWKFKIGDVISKNKAKDRPAVIIIELCKHGMQLGGLCVVCGKDMTNVDYTGFSDASRASIQMTHSAFGPTVSFEEAQRIERETAEHLLRSRKLSLIVDLDQTIVHATVDPTVGEWIAEGEAWEARQAKKASTTPRNSDDSDDSLSDSDDECNPNWEALKDVKKFRLGPESFLSPSMRGHHKNKGKQKMVENEGCMYYIKPRPGWKDFFNNMSTKYDMHVYTMGTRAYAEEVCAAIDPDGNIFKSRILSRDESGSLTQKSLQRLFPCDTSMVVIIDDRADVWDWSPNLIKVIPYDFFIGIGDINSSFLAKITPLVPVPTPSTQQPTLPSGESTSNPPSTTNDIDDANTATVLPDSSEPLTPEDVEKAEIEQKILLTTNNAALDEQFEQRPLAKKQEELVTHESSNQPQETDSEDQTPKDEKPAENLVTVHHHEKPKQALLRNDDTELVRVEKLLDEVHGRFFEAYDARYPENSRRKLASASRAYDVTRIIPRIRSEVLADVHLVFSGVIPLDTPPETTEYWRLAHMFGAKCYTDLAPEVTHVVTAKRGTRKVELARKRRGIKIVEPTWFQESIHRWERQNEDRYILNDPPVSAPSMSPLISEHQISSDPEPDADDWDVDPVELQARVQADEGGQGNKTGALHLDEIDWGDINDEVEAAMMDSDDDSVDERSGTRSEDEWTDEGSVTSTNNSASNTPRLKRKRLRSVTPSEISNKEIDNTRSPLAKRKKLAAERMGYSRLKEAITADDLPESKPVVTQSTLFGGVNGGQQEEEEEEEYIDDEDDFLARDLQDWG